MSKILLCICSVFSRVWTSRLFPTPGCCERCSNESGHTHIDVTRCRVLLRKQKSVLEYRDVNGNKSWGFSKLELSECPLGLYGDTTCFGRGCLKGLGVIHPTQHSHRQLLIWLSIPLCGEEQDALPVLEKLVCKSSYSLKQKHSKEKHLVIKQFMIKRKECN